MNEVDVDPVDVGLELLELIESPLLCAPIVLVAPVSDDLLQVGKVGAVGPTGAIELVGEARTGESLVQIGQHGVWHVDPEGHDCRLRRWMRRKNGNGR